MSGVSESVCGFWHISKLLFNDVSRSCGKKPVFRILQLLLRLLHRHSSSMCENNVFGRRFGNNERVCVQMLVMPYVMIL